MAATPNFNDSCHDEALNPGINDAYLDGAPNTVLVVGTPPTLRIFVAADMLVVTSTVFQNMVLLNAEGTGPHDCEEIELPDDNPSAMLDLCRLMYKQHHNFVHNMNKDRLYELLCVIDKYRGIDRFRDQMSGHVEFVLNTFDRNHGPDLSFEEAVFETALAFLADDASFVKRTTEYLIRNFNNRFSEIHSTDIKGGHVIPLNALLAMTEIRDVAISKAVSEIEDKCNTEVAEQDPEFNIENHIFLTDVGTSETLDTCINVLTDKEGLPELLRTLGAELEELCVGLCLECVKMGKVGLSDGGCAGGHDVDM